MTLLKVERIKLFSTRSPWWCMIVAVAITIGFTALLSAALRGDDLLFYRPAATQFAYNFGLLIMMVMAVLAVTTEYRFGTIRASFLAVPTRTSLLLAKTVVVALLAGVVGELAAIGCWLIARAIRPDSPLSLQTAADYRVVFGVGLVYLISAIIAVAVGLMIRHSAGAISALLAWSLVVENLIQIIPNVGEDIQKWLPFVVGNNFLYSGQSFFASGETGTLDDMPFGPWGSLIYFAVVALALLAIGLGLAKHRDA
ncbi:MAG: hypothetical protein IRZ08_14900 [Frankia sp.]|nr:hypothetical protein [Frankia sp.]